MPKLPALTSKKIIRILKKSGFHLDHKTGSHFIFYDSQNKRRATVPFHTKDLPKGTLLSILKQAGITKEELEKYL
ncbi:MAG: type II toxin-antitoxin system HicA family toxin [Nitrospirae bacterium]|nr:type II toxin-antitoxin system HicA family toxin [Nitrospirota bacterium]